MQSSGDESSVGPPQEGEEQEDEETLVKRPGMERFVMKTPAVKG